MLEADSGIKLFFVRCLIISVIAFMFVFNATIATPGDPLPGDSPDFPVPNSDDYGVKHGSMLVGECFDLETGSVIGDAINGVLCDLEVEGDLRFDLRGTTNPNYLYYPVRSKVILDPSKNMFEAVNKKILTHSLVFNDFFWGNSGVIFYPEQTRLLKTSDGSIYKIGRVTCEVRLPEYQDYDCYHIDPDSIDHDLHRVRFQYEKLN